MEVITYILETTESNTAQYYESVQELADQVIRVALGQLQPIILDYQESRPKQSVEHCILELLLLGIYARRQAQFKFITDHLDVELLNTALNYLSQSGDYQYLSKKMRLWFAYLASQPYEKRDLYWRLMNAAVDWFSKRSLEVLGSYTRNVESFLATKYKPDRADAVFCGSSRLEYHINMVGAEILNHLNRERFLATDNKILALPGCMRTNNSNCKAKPADLGLECKQCSSKCQVNEITELGLQNGFGVNFVEHQSSLASNAKKLKQMDNQLGIVGVACVPALLEGGYMLEEHGFPAQCVLLDYCGCVTHWHEQGIVTHMNITRLLEIFY